jgi:asparagine synthase (glutamine-hydrolysing)
MPGICLWLSTNPNTEELALRFKRAQDAMLHGPHYHSEVYVKRRGCLVGMTAYPEYPIRIISHEGYSVVLEGYVYNKRGDEVESELISLAKVIFAADHDGASEIVRDWVLGADGDFAVAMVSPDGCQVAAISDYLGRLPIYIYNGKAGLVIGRECKFIALISGEARFDSLGWAQHLWLGYPLGKRTLFEGIDRAPGGLFLKAGMKRGLTETTLRQTWVLNLDEKDDSQRSVRDCGAALADLARTAIVSRARAHDSVKNVLSLSGGHDSRTVASTLHCEGYEFASVSQGRPDSKSRADARVAAHIASTLNVPWTLVPLATKPRDEEELVWLKDGLNYVGTAFMLPYLRIIASRWGNGAIYWTGDGGDKIFPDLRPSRAITTENALIGGIIEGHGLMQADFAEEVAGVQQGSLLEELRDQIACYPESTFRQKAVHFSIYERGRKWLFEGEDRNRFFLWQVSPFYANPLFLLAMRMPDELKEGYRLYREVQLVLGPAVARIAHAQVGVAIASPLFSWKLKIDSAVRRLPRPLKSGLKRIMRRGEWTEISAAGSRADWTVLAAEAIRHGLPMATGPVAALVERANTSQFDFWRTLVLLDQLRSGGRYSTGA